MSYMSLYDPTLYDSTVLPSSRRERRGDKARAKRRRRRRFRTFLSLVVTLGLIGAAVWGAWGGLKGIVNTITEPDDWPGPGSGKVRVQIDEGATGQSIADTLQAAGVVKTSRAFIKAAKANPRTKEIQPGTYQLRRQMSAAGAVELLLDPASRLIRKVTIREGLRVSDIVNVLVKEGSMKRSALIAALKDPPAIGLPKSAKGKAEGYLFPATYEFQPDTSEAEALRTMVTRGQQVMTDLGVKKSQQRTVLIKASLVQSEGGSVKDFGKIARVVENRLDDGMKLQLDSTVHYGTHTKGVFTTPAQRADDNPYNTYLHTGLPGGPISAPGEEAINAVLDPPAGKWLYFVVVDLDTGETKFATTSAGHARNVAELQAWLAAHR